MSRRRRYRPEFDEHLSGVLAHHDGTCPRCDRPIIANQTQVVRHRDDWIHVTCAPGFER